MGFKELFDEDEIQRAVDTHEFTVICFVNPELEEEQGYMTRFEELADMPCYASFGFYRVDPLSSYEFMESLGIEDTPTTRIFKNGEKVGEVEGLPIGSAVKKFYEVIK